MVKKKKSKKRKSKARKKSSKKRKVIKRRAKTKKTRVRKNLKKKKNNKKTDNISSPELIIKTKPEWIKSSLVSKSQYQKKYSESIKNNNVFWKKEGKRITWIKPYKKIKDVKYSKEDV